jgi:hypothetical protein
VPYCNNLAIFQQELRCCCSIVFAVIVRRRKIDENLSRSSSSHYLYASNFFIGDGQFHASFAIHNQQPHSRSVGFSLFPFASSTRSLTQSVSQYHVLLAFLFAFQLFYPVVGKERLFYIQQFLCVIIFWFNVI